MKKSLEVTAIKQIISYPLREGDPTWPGNPTIHITEHTSILQGDVANTCTIHLFNHFGTHFDAPRHFNAGGPAIAQLSPDWFFYQAPLLLDIPKKPCEKVEPEDLIPYEKSIAVCDLLMLRTGFFAVREQDADCYQSQGPGISSRCAGYLMEHFPGLKALALDFVSLASYSDQKDGNLAHQTLLGKFHDRFICIIEDVNMGGLPAGLLAGAGAVPLMVEEADSCPVTMWVEL